MATDEELPPYAVRNETEEMSEAKAVLFVLFWLVLFFLLGFVIGGITQKRWQWVGSGIHQLQDYEDRRLHPGDAKK